MGRGVPPTTPGDAPQSPEADLLGELSVLGGVFRYGTDAYLDVADILRVESFTLPENQAIYRCLQHALGGTERVGSLDRPSLYAAASSVGLSDYLQSPSISSHVESVLRVPVELESVRRLALRLRKLDVARDLTLRHHKALADLAAVRGDESIDDILRLSEEPTASVLAELSGGLRQVQVRPMAEGARERFRALIRTPLPQVGVPSGFSRFDRAIGGGFRPGAVDLICSRMKVGKSSLCNNVALTVAGRLGIPVLYVDTEMTIEEQQNRACAALAGVLVKKLETGDLTREEQVRLGEALKKYEAMPYDHAEMLDLSFEDILTHVRRWVARRVGFRGDGKANACLIIFDYFQIVSQADVGRQFAEWQVLGHMMTRLKNLMKQLGTPCLCFAQANRDGLDYKDERILRGADRILDKVTSFWVFCRKPEEAILPARPGEPRLTHELYYCFSRFGEGLARENYLNIATDYARGFMCEGPTRDELYQLQGGHLKGVAPGKVAEAGPTPSLPFENTDNLEPPDDALDPA